MNLQKNKPWRSKKYRDWIKTLDCVATGLPADDFHHITGTKQGGTGTKPGDNYCIPLTRLMHTLLHNNPERWESTYGEQKNHLKNTIEIAHHSGKLPDHLFNWIVELYE